MKQNQITALVSRPDLLSVFIAYKVTDNTRMPNSHPKFQQLLYSTLMTTQNKSWVRIKVRNRVVVRDWVRNRHTVRVSVMTTKYSQCQS